MAEILRIKNEMVKIETKITPQSSEMKKGTKGRKEKVNERKKGEREQKGE